MVYPPFSASPTSVRGNRASNGVLTLRETGSSEGGHGDREYN